MVSSELLRMRVWIIYHIREALKVDKKVLQKKSSFSGGNSNKEKAIQQKMEIAEFKADGGKKRSETQIKVIKANYAD